MVRPQSCEAFNILTRYHIFSVRFKIGARLRVDTTAEGQQRCQRSKANLAIAYGSSVGIVGLPIFNCGTLYYTAI
jgi:hypothetical protein